MRQPGVFFTIYSSVLISVACAGGEPKGDDDSADAARGQALSISGVSPERGPLAGGTTITISGENLGDETGMVVIGDLVATSVSVVDENTITAVTPPGVRSETVDITVFSALGYGVAGEAFSYNPVPTVTDVQPRIGDIGENLTITGTGFSDNEAGDVTVGIGEGSCSDINVVSDTEIRCSASDGGAAYVLNQVQVENANGSADFASFAFRGDGLFVSTARNTNQDRNSIYFIDPEADSPEPQYVGEIDTHFQSIVKSPQGTYFVRQDNGNSLATVDMDTLSSTLIGPMNQSIADMSFNGDQLIGFRRCASTLTRIDTDTGVTTDIPNAPGSTPTNCVRGLQQIADNTFVLIHQANQVVQQTTVDAAGLLATTTDRFTLQGTPDRFRSMTTYNGRIYAVRFGGSFLPPPGGGGLQLMTLVELDLDLGVATDVALLPPSAHSIVRTN